MNKSLKVWIFQTGEPLPTDPGNPRPMRAMNLANALVSAGHSTVLWSSAFYHQKRVHRTHCYEHQRVNDKLEVRLIPSMGYQRNIGPGRLLDHAQLAFNLARALAREEDTPDVAFVGYPPIEYAHVAVSWLKKRGVPTMLDVKDQWPDIFTEPFPPIVQPIVRMMLLPYYAMGRRAMREATALSTMATSFLDWMRRFSGRLPNPLDGVFPLSPMQERVPGELIDVAGQWWKYHGVEDDGRARFFFVGSLTRSFDFLPVKRAAEIALERGCNWQFVVCGDGNDAIAVQRMFEGLPNVILPGWVDRPQILALAGMSIAGLAPYRNTPDFLLSVPNKVVDYIALFQPVITPLRGEVESLIQKFGVGLVYRESSGEHLYECLKVLSLDVQARQEMARKARALYEEHFMGEKVYADLVRRLEVLAESGNRECAQ